MSELRIGNIVSYNGYMYRIGALSKEYPFLDTDEFGVGVITYDNIEGIILTFELLKKCGFEHCWGGVYELKNGFGVYGSLRNGWMVSQSRDIPNIKGVEYLHQLQNLIYALTGEELKFQP